VDPDGGGDIWVRTPATRGSQSASASASRLIPAKFTCSTRNRRRAAAPPALEDFLLDGRTARLTIRRDWPRPDPAAIEAFRGVPTGFVVDALGRSGALDYRIRPVWEGPAFVGTALPVWTTARDNLAPYAAVRFANPAT
jgi:hypothetical protein